MLECTFQKNSSGKNTFTNEVIQLHERTSGHKMTRTAFLVKSGRSGSSIDFRYAFLVISEPSLPYLIASSIIICNGCCHDILQICVLTLRGEKQQELERDERNLMCQLILSALIRQEERTTLARRDS